MGNEKEEKQTTPDLTQIMLEGRQVFDADTPAEESAAPGNPDKKTGPDAETEKGEEAPVKPEEKKPPEEQEEVTPPVKPGEEKPVEKAPEKPAAEAAHTKKEEKPPEHARRFKDLDAAEEGYRNLQGKATKAEQRAAELEKENLRLKGEREQEVAAAQHKTALQTYRKEVLDYGKTRKAKALADVDKLDPDAPDYQAQAAELLTEADLDIDEFRREKYPQSPAPSVPAKEEPAPGKPAGETTENGALPADKVEEINLHIETELEKAGIEKTDPLFWLYADQAPTKGEDGQPLTLDQQINWALTQTRNYQTTLQGKIKAKNEEEAGKKSLQHQEQELPLGRGGNPTGKAAEEAAGKKADEAKPMSLESANDWALEQRRL